MSDNTDLYNIKIKRYKDRIRIVTYSNPIKSIKKQSQSKIKEESKINYKYLKDSKAGAIQAFCDLGFANEWEYLLTFTFDNKKMNLDRFDYLSVTKKMKYWLNEMRRKNPDMMYLGVPELHNGPKSQCKCSVCGTIFTNNLVKCPSCSSYEKKYAYHFHFLISNIDNLEFKNSNKYCFIDGEKTIIYNIENFENGFTTATKIKNSENTVIYVAKCMKKPAVKNVPFGKKMYWHSRNLLEIKVEEKLISLSELQGLEEVLKKGNKYLKEIKVNNSNYKNSISIYEFSQESYKNIKI